MPPQSELLYPELAVIDSHHHLIDRAPPALAKHLGLDRFLVDDYAEMVGASGHHVVASVVMEARQMPRRDGPDALRFVGETEFVNGQAAMAASGLYGPCRTGAGFVAYADLRDEAVGDVLAGHMAAAPTRLKGVRQEGMWDADPVVLGGLFDVPEHLYDDRQFRRGFAHLAPLGLSFDAFVLAPQLSDVIRLARDFPETSIILNHVGSPVGIGAYRGRLDEQFSEWRRDMAALAASSNVAVKLGGLGSFLLGSDFYRADVPPSEDRLVAEWERWIHTTLDQFGADRCMFESNLPTDGSGNFRTVCNAYKRMTEGCSGPEREAIFAGTAARIYRLGDVTALPLPNDASAESDGAATFTDPDPTSNHARTYEQHTTAGESPVDHRGRRRHVRDPQRGDRRT